MAIENAEREISQVYWVSDFWAKQYYAHYRYFLKVIRPRVPISVRRSHPYLYINDCPKTVFFGHPMKMSNLKKATERAFARVGLDPYKYNHSIYGLRHSYVKISRKLGLDPDVRQQILRHLSIEAQDAYGHWTSGELNRKLRSLLD
jgi:integrase